MILRIISLLFGLFLLSTCQETPRAAADRIRWLPGSTFVEDFTQYSGFLSANDTLNGVTAQFHYWLVMAKQSVQNAPLIVWLNGGPGCSSLSGLFVENGPFRPSQDGKQLNENVYAWNRFSNVLYLESPAGVGFNPQTSTTWDDAKVAQANYFALNDFFTVYPDAGKNGVFLSGEGYASVYVTTLGNVIADNISAGKNTINLQGILIGNGLLSIRKHYNAMIEFSYAKGMNFKEDFDNLTATCCGNDSSPMNCDYYSYDFQNSDCGKMAYAFYTKLQKPEVDPYNIYQECYQLAKNQASANEFYGLELAANYNSSDPFDGFPCFAEDAITNYLQRADVQSEIHVLADQQKPIQWRSCSTLTNYGQQQSGDISIALGRLVNSLIWRQNNLRLLLYNGDLDLSSNHVGAQWFVEALNQQALTNGGDWRFSLNDSLYVGSTGGYYKSFDRQITFATIKGAGHFVPLSRPAQILQLVRNFVTNSTIA
ncbi:unnamed protein product, partial [Mesorhabditis belari]|uniref:Serine carboxypeptidase n=1 Tax=Mesorhabditis belari TaxID=2138241 RepID=A0AAF3J8F0_9BILA